MISATDGGIATPSGSLPLNPANPKTSPRRASKLTSLPFSPLLHPWFDRELSIAGRVCCKMADGSMHTLLIDFQRPIAIIPSLAIHFNRDANKDRT